MLRSIAVLAQAPLAYFELGVLVEVFGIDRTAEGVPPFDFRICAPAEPTATAADPPDGTPSSDRSAPPTGGSVGTAVPGLHLVGLRPIAEAADADLVAVPSSPVEGPPHPEVAAAVRAAHERGAYVLSMCSGTYALAWAGLLTGRRAATHWRYAPDLQRRFPQIAVDDTVLYAQDGRVITGAGTAAGIDACLHLVRLEHGNAVAAAIARRMVVPPHREGGQKQFIERPVPDAGSSLQPLMDHLVEHLEDSHTAQSMAAVAVMSPRTLARHFTAQTGSTPHAWLTAQRVLAARRLLEDTDLPLDAIAHHTGLSDAALLRHHFQRAMGVTPTAYRRSFGR